MSSESGVALCSFHICTYCPCDIPTTTLVPLPSYMVNWPTNLLKNDGDDHDQRHVCSTKFLQNNASPPSATHNDRTTCVCHGVCCSDDDDDRSRRSRLTQPCSDRPGRTTMLLLTICKLLPVAHGHPSFASAGVGSTRNRQATEAGRPKPDKFGTMTTTEGVNP